MIDNISPEELLILANTFALSLSEGRSADEINVLGNFIVAVGSMMLTFAAQLQNISSQQEAKKAKTEGASSNNNTQQESEKTRTEEAFSNNNSPQESEKTKSEEASSDNISPQDAEITRTEEASSNNSFQQELEGFYNDEFPFDYY